MFGAGDKLKEASKTSESLKVRARGCQWFAWSMLPFNKYIVD